MFPNHLMKFVNQTRKCNDQINGIKVSKVFSVSSDSTHGAIADNPFKARVSVLQAQAEYLTIENVTCESLDEQCRNGSNTSEDQVSTG